MAKQPLIVENGAVCSTLYVMHRFRLWNNQYISAGEMMGVLVVTILFVGALIVTHHYGETIENIVFFEGPLGMVLYVLLAFLGVVLAPAASLPFLPIAVSLWGATTTALLSIAGWGSGAIVAFVLARRYGQPFVGKFLSIRRAERISERLIGKHTFWFVLISRTFLPSDITSYAIGLFVPIRFMPYSVATLIGITPLAFGLAYGVSLPLELQATITALVGAIILCTILLLSIRARYFKSRSRQTQDSIS